MYKTYGDIAAIENMLGKNWLFLHNPKNVEHMFRNEGVWPKRAELDSIIYYRKDFRKDWFKKTTGLLVENGEKWQEFRSVVNPILMQPRVAAQYVSSMDEVATDFIEVVKKFANKNPTGEMPADFETELNKWALESICLIALEKRLGCLEETPNPEAQKIIKSVLTAFDLLFKLDFQISFWKWFNTPDWKLFVQSVDFTIE